MGLDHVDSATKQLGSGRRIALGRGVNDGERRIRPDLFTDSAHVGETDPWIDRVGDAPAPAAQADHSQPERARIDRRDGARSFEVHRVAHRRLG